MQKQKMFEIIENIAPESTIERKFIAGLVGKISLPETLTESYYRSRNSDQLVMPHYAYPFNTVEIDVSGRDILV